MLPVASAAGRHTALLETESQRRQQTGDQNNKQRVGD